MKILITLLKPFSFAPAILMMYVIYSFSAQTGDVSGALSYKVSYQIVETKNEILASGKVPEQLSQEAAGIEFYVRKAAHMTEYCLLAISISFPLYVYGVRGIWLMLLAGFVCVGFAGLDEYHQSFVDARGPSVRDVGIDSCGAMIGILLVQAFCWSTLHTPSRKKSRKKLKKLLTFRSPSAILVKHLTERPKRKKPDRPLRSRSKRYRFRAFRGCECTL